MAAMVKLMQRRNGIITDIYERMRDAETNRFVEFKAAVRIQAWFRGIRVRNRVRNLSRCAVKIQKIWRGFLARDYYRQRLKQEVYLMQFNYYSLMAVQIQKIWRGYHSRRCIFNFNSRKKYFQDLELKNQMIRARLAEHVEQQAEEKMWKEAEAAKQKLEEFAKQNHFLISTTVIPGIYNSPFLLVPNEMEYHLRQVKPQRTNRSCKSAKLADENTFDPAWRRYDAPTFAPLPPVGDKPKGPFLDPREVQWQRYRPFNPTLRVESNYYSVKEARQKMKADEWVARIQDRIFLPSKQLPPQPYEPLSWTTSEYGQIAYGTKHFRDEYPDLWTSKNFQTVLPPIHAFDKFNKTYSRGEV